MEENLYFDINEIPCYSNELLCSDCISSYIQCQECSAYFTIDFYIHDHVTKCTERHELFKLREKFSECNKCFTYVPIEQISTHKESCQATNLSIPVESKLECEICGGKFSESLLADHIKFCKEIESKKALLNQYIQCDFCQEKVGLLGIESHESKCLQLKEKQAKLENRINLIEINYPKNWEDEIFDVKIVDENLSIVNLDKNGSQFNFIVELMYKTISSKTYSVLNVYRLQNRFLWDKYTREKEKIIVEKGSAEEQWLFHGTRSNNPRALYNNGFDISFASDTGSFGRGIYFARQASYSLPNYCFMSRGKIYLFLAKVITGIPHVSGSLSRSVINDYKSLKKPPLMDEFKFIYYDSVTDVKNKKKRHVSQMYIVYENDKAYPYYLIEIDFQKSTLDNNIFNLHRHLQVNKDEDVI
jgi:hypothetical protein